MYIGKNYSQNTGTLYSQSTKVNQKKRNFSFYSTKKNSILKHILNREKRFLINFSSSPYFINKNNNNNNNLITNDNRTEL